MLNSIISGRMSQSGFSSELSLCYIAHCETFHRLHECAMDGRSMCRIIGESIDQSTDGSLYSEHRLCLVISVFKYGRCRVSTWCATSRGSHDMRGSHFRRFLAGSCAGIKGTTVDTAPPLLKNSEPCSVLLFFFEQKLFCFAESSALDF